MYPHWIFQCTKLEYQAYRHVFKPMSFVFYEWTRERKFTLHSEMKPGECSNANTRTCNGITN